IPTVVIIGAMYIQKLAKSVTAIKSAHLSLDVRELYGPHTETFYYGAPKYFNAYSDLNSKKYGANVSKLNGTTDASVNAWILDRVGADLDSYIEKYLYGLGVMDTETNLWFNTEQYHSMPLGVNVLFETLLRALVPQ